MVRFDCSRIFLLQKWRTLYSCLIHAVKVGNIQLLLESLHALRKHHKSIFNRSLWLLPANEPKGTRFIEGGLKVKTSFCDDWNFTPVQCLVGHLPILFPSCTGKLIIYGTKWGIDQVLCVTIWQKMCWEVSGALLASAIVMLTMRRRGWFGLNKRKKKLIWSFFSAFNCETFTHKKPVTE